MKTKVNNILFNEKKTCLEYFCDPRRLDLTIDPREMELFVLQLS